MNINRKLQKKLNEWNEIECSTKEWRQVGSVTNGGWYFIKPGKPNLYTTPMLVNYTNDRATKVNECEGMTTLEISFVLEGITREIKAKQKEISHDTTKPFSWPPRAPMGQK